MPGRDTGFGAELDVPSQFLDAFNFLADIRSQLLRAKRLLVLNFFGDLALIFLLQVLQNFAKVALAAL